jgi:hypothetical protein
MVAVHKKRSPLRTPFDFAQGRQRSTKEHLGSVCTFSSLACYGALSLESCDRVQMADGNGQGVRGVEWFWGLRKF